MLLLLLALLQTPSSSVLPPEEAKATLQSCQMTDKGWVCHYQIPSTTIIRPLEGAGEEPAVAAAPSLPLTPAPAEPAAAKPPAPAAAPHDDAAEASRQTRLIARCADAKWYSPCLPGERTEARMLRDAAHNATALRGKVTTLLSEQRCDEAIKAALEGGDLPLAREARAFCAPDR